MSTIEKLNGKNMEIDKNDKFFIENKKRVNALLNARNKFISKLNSKVRELLDITPKPVECERQWIYAKSCLVHDFLLSGHSIAFDLYISPQGWELQLFGRNIKSQAYLTDINPCSDSHLLVMPNCVAMVLERCHRHLRLIAVMIACLLEVSNLKKLWALVRVTVVFDFMIDS